MPDDVKGALFDALKISIVGALTFFFAPWVETTFAWAPDWLRFAVPAFVIAFALLLLWLLFTTKARLTVQWRLSDGPDVDVTPVVVELDGARNGDSTATYIVSVIHSGAKGLGWVALRLAVWSGIGIRIRVAHSDMVMALESAQASLTSGDIKLGNDCSVELALRKPQPARGTTWARVAFKLNGRHPSPPTPWTAVHERVPSGRLARACGKLIRIDAKVESVVETWK